jgi:hypothetical protein
MDNKKKYKHVINWRRRTKARMVEAFGGECAICKIKSYPEIYDFHHLDPTQKDFSVGGLSVKAWDKLVKELRKCIMLCGNCHRLFHCGYIEIPLNVKRFDEKYVEYIQTSSNGRTLIKKENGQFAIDENGIMTRGIKTPCPICKKLKPRNNKYCSIECSGKARRKITERPTKEDLQELIIKYTFKYVGKLFNVTDNTIRKWCYAYGISYKR